MGKSPGRWIKTVLFGKKNSKSNLSMNAACKKAAEKVSIVDPSGDSLVTSNPSVITERDAKNLELENNTFGVPCGTAASFPVNEGVESQCNHVPLPVSDAEMRKQGQAAAKIQATFKGYLARRAFWALKGIIRLQALIRGHLVRRQAVATLRCMNAIVKFQALARGRRVRLSSTWSELNNKHWLEKLQDAQLMDIGANSIFRSEKLARNAYVRKLLLSLPTAAPLSFQYDLSEPNSAWNWLERWSLYRFWGPHAQTKRVVHVKPQKKQGASRTVEADVGKSKRTIRKGSSAANGDPGASASFEVDKPKRIPRKVVVTSHQTEGVQEQPQNELERVKCNLKKVSTSVTTGEQSEIETEKPQQMIDKPVSRVSEQEILVAAGIPNDLDINKRALVEAPEIKIGDELLDTSLEDHLYVESHSLENGLEVENAPVHEKSISMEDAIGKENRMVRKRRSLPIKQDYTESITHNTPALPSYMAATASAKAKLRAQGSPKFSDHGAEQGYVRRHSLPAPNNLSSLSPRIQKPVPANSKGSAKTNRPATLSRDDKVLQPGWRR